MSDDLKRTRATPASVACIGKVAFEGYRQALAVVNRHQTKARPGRTAYHCGHCQLWHVGTNDRLVQKRRASDFKERKDRD